MVSADRLIEDLYPGQPPIEGAGGSKTTPQCVASKLPVSGQANRTEVVFCQNAHVSSGFTLQRGMHAR